MLITCRNALHMLGHEGPSPRLAMRTAFRISSVNSLGKLDGMHLMSSFDLGGPWCD